MITYTNGSINIIIGNNTYSILENDAKDVLSELKSLYEEKTFNSEWFEDAWSKYPKKLDRKAAIRHFKKLIKNKESYDNLLTAIENYIKHCVKNKSLQYIMNGGRFFLNYEDWVTYNPKDEIKVIENTIKNNQECSIPKLDVAEKIEIKNKPGKFNRDLFKKG
jgi:hypothetical protein